MAVETTDFVPPSEDDVYAHIDSIPPRLRRCAAAQHNWQPHDWTGYKASGALLKPKEDPRRAVSFEVTEVCGGGAGCGLRRHHSFSVAGERVYDRTAFTYSQRNENLTSPYGISTTGISVRREVSNDNMYRRIIGAGRVHLAPAGATKKALGRKAA
ncbi:hypothetical protein [Streptomyces sp. MMBL 11-1]|uniref:hypothetical protein n=1 Tax=Streptomyces sp. MMBL 11-1 TaxID=3026420 RepID=UPI00235F4A3B|nr:hypothetical protein [Streptomyces sp. MMBL 11-1]